MTTTHFNDLRQLMVDAAAALENLTDLETYGDGTGQYGDEQAEAVAIAGRLRDCAAAAPQLFDALRQCAETLRVQRAYTRGKCPWSASDQVALDDADRAIAMAEGRG